MKKAYKICVPLALRASTVGGIVLMVTGGLPLLGGWVLLTSIAALITWFARE